MVSRNVLSNWLVVVFLLLGGTTIAGGIGKKPDNLVTAMEVRSLAEATQVVLQGTKKPTFTVFKLRNPDRLILDLIHADFDESLTSKPNVDDKRISRIATTQFQQAGSQVSRVIIGLAPNVKFDAHAQGKSVVVSLTDPKKKTNQVNASAAIQDGTKTQTKTKPVELAKTNNPVNKAMPDKIPTPAAPETKKDYDVIAQYGSKHDAGRLLIKRISGSGKTVNVITDQPVKAYEVLEVHTPRRFVLDVYGAHVKPKRSSQKTNNPYFNHLRVGKHSDKVRLVLDLQNARVQYQVKRLSRGVQIQFSDPAQLTATAAKTKSAENKPRSAAKTKQTKPLEPQPQPRVKAQKTKPVQLAKRSKPESATKVPAPVRASDALKSKKTQLTKLTDLTFQQEENQARVVLDLAGPARPKLVHADEHSTMIEIQACKMPVILERTLDTSEFGTAIQSLSAFRDQDAHTVKIVAKTSQQVPNHFERREGKLHWVFEAKKPKLRIAQTKQPRSDYTYQPDQVAGYSVQRPDYSDDAGAGSGSKRRTYSGRRISLDFKDADIHNILRLISEVAKLNIITSDEVKGTITITMRNVPWDQALDIILKTKKLGKVRHGNIIRIAPLIEIAKEQELAAQAAAAKRIAEPLRLRLIPVNYASAKDVKDQVKGVLSKRGSVSIDKRTNVLIVKGVLENLIKAEGLVRSLDKETPQVLIEARIVEANTQYLREVGVQWGGHLNFADAYGNPTGLPFPSNLLIEGGADDTTSVTTGTGNPGQFAINMPAAVGAGSGGSLGFIFGTAGGIAQLNLRLSALENRGAVKIISAPKITTLDNNRAKIGQGVSIPISVVSAAGVNTMFVEAKLELEVTPHITQDGAVLMSIKVKKNEPDFSRTGAKGDPTILKKEAETQVLVKDGDTTVIGGIYTRKTSDTLTGIPFLSQIPILGFIFRNKKNADDRTELLIFITPRIVNRLQATVSQR